MTPRCVSVEGKQSEHVESYKLLVFYFDPILTNYYRGESSRSELFLERKFRGPKHPLSDLSEG